MTTWKDFTDADAELATAVAARFAANLHHVMATIAGDGSPRLSGMEVPIRDGHLWLGMMPSSVKRADLDRDPRFALHSAPLEEDLAEGDAKLSARAVPVAPGSAEWATFIAGSDIDDPDDLPGGGMGLYVADLQRVTLTRVSEDALHVTTWTPAGGTSTRTTG